MGLILSAPLLLSPLHDVAEFQSGEYVLDEWLRRRAFKNQQEGASRTYVIAIDQRVIGYYALANGSIVGTDTPGRIRRNMPDIIPVMVLGRLAIDQQWQGKGLGKALLQDAILRMLQAAEIAGIRAILVHALHEKAASFYRNAGFVTSPTNQLTLLLLLKNVSAALTE